MTADLLPLLMAGIFVIALLYSSVGHAGASGYIAIMSLCSMTPDEIKATALVLNILVASITTYQFWRAGHFSWVLFWPFALLAMPFAFIGGYIHLPVQIFKILVGCILLYSAARFLLKPPIEGSHPRAPSRSLALGVGAGLGLLSGLTGTGGGIFLTPLVIFMGWARTIVASGISAPFILVNSFFGLLGNFSATQNLPAFVLPLAGAALVGGTIGSYLGSKKLPHTAIKRLLAIVLAIAGVKFLMT
jgi:uncharacterized protein